MADFYMTFPPLPNQATQDFIDASGITATGNMFDDFRSALVAILELTDHNNLTLDDLWQLYVINVVSADANTESGNPAAAGRGKSGWVGQNPGLYYAESHRRNPSGGGFPAGGGGGLEQLVDKSSAPDALNGLVRGLSVSPDGLNAIWFDTSFNLIRGGTMSPAHDVTTLVEATSRAEWQANNFGSYTKPDGLLHIQCSSAGIDYAEMSVAWDVSTLGARIFAGAIVGASNQLQGVSMSADGDWLYVGRTPSIIQQHEVSTPWDLSTLNLTATSTVDLSSTRASDVGFADGHLDFNLDGTKLYFSNTSISVAEYTLSTAWDITTAVHTGVTVAVQGDLSGFHYDRTGDDKFYIAVANTDDIRQYASFEDPSPAAEANEGKPANKYLQVEAFNLPTGGNGQAGLCFKPDGTEMYLANTTDNVLKQYTLSVAWDVSTATETNSIAENLVTPQGMSISSDGLKLFQSDGNEIIDWDMSVAWDLSTALFNSTQALTSATTNGITFSDDGFTLVVVHTGERLKSYSLTTAWDISTMGTADNDINILTDLNEDSSGPNPAYCSFDGTGNRLYIVSSNRYIVEYYLSTAWDVSTAVYTKRRAYETDSITGIHVRRDDGSQIFTVHANNEVKTWDYSG